MKALLQFLRKAHFNFLSKSLTNANNHNILSSKTFTLGSSSSFQRDRPLSSKTLNHTSSFSPHHFTAAGDCVLTHITALCRVLVRKSAPRELNRQFRPHFLTGFQTHSGQSSRWLMCSSSRLRRHHHPVLKSAL